MWGLSPGFQTPGVGEGLGKSRLGDKGQGCCPCPEKVVPGPWGDVPHLKAAGRAPAGEEKSWWAKGGPMQ